MKIKLSKKNGLQLIRNLKNKVCSTNYEGVTIKLMSK